MRLSDRDGRRLPAHCWCGPKRKRQCLVTPKPAYHLDTLGIIHVPSHSRGLGTAQHGQHLQGCPWTSAHWGSARVPESVDSSVGSAVSGDHSHAGVPQLPLGPREREKEQPLRAPKPASTQQPGRHQGPTVDAIIWGLLWWPGLRRVGVPTGVPEKLRCAGVWGEGKVAAEGVWL